MRSRSRARHREIAGLRALPAFAVELAQRPERQPQRRHQPIDAAARAAARSRAAKFHSSAASPCGEHGIGQFARQQNAVAGDEPARLGEPAMRGDEIGARQAIAVEEDAEFAGARANAAVADLAAAEAEMLVADVLERHRQARRPAFDDARGVRPRAVVGNDDLEIAVRLMRQARAAPRRAHRRGYRS